MWEKIKKHGAKIISVLISIVLVIGGVFAIKNREENKNNATDDLSNDAANEENQASPIEAAAELNALESDSAGEISSENTQAVEQPTLNVTTDVDNTAATQVAPKNTTTTNTSTTTPQIAPKAKTKTKSS